MDESFAPALRQLAAKVGISPASLHIEGNAVFLRQGNALVGTVFPTSKRPRSTMELAAEVLARLQEREIHPKRWIGLRLPSDQGAG